MYISDTVSLLELLTLWSISEVAAVAATMLDFGESEPSESEDHLELRRTLNYVAERSFISFQDNVVHVHFSFLGIYDIRIDIDTFNEHFDLGHTVGARGLLSY